MIIPPTTRDAQLKATDPAASAFVSANAGSGKTYVLTRRVIRLLLAGADPGRILCLTFTKAAAAEMSNRVFAELRRWARLEDAALLATIAEIEGRPAAAERLAPARRLFARALETPGGLKVQTLHAFAEALLQRFALEANLDGRFRVLDEGKAADLFAEARAELIGEAAAAPHSPLGAALALLAGLVSEQALDEALAALVAAREDFRDFILAHGDLEAALAALPAALGVPAGATATTLEASIFPSAEFPGPYLSRLIDICDDASPTMKTWAGEARAVVATAETDAGKARRRWRALFLTDKGEARKRAFTAAVAKALPDAGDRFLREAERLAAAERTLAGLRTAERTAALARLADRLIGRVDAAKARLGVLDFDDLIARTAALLSRSDAAAWVQYKLDEGLDHVLVDEAQDTSPRQWQIIEALTGEFHAGAGARRTRRTIFAVGDEKQSIYSFQGAVPHLFGEERRRLGARLRAARLPVHDLRLTLSFRSTAAVIQAVDKVFAPPQAHEGLSTDAGPTFHETARGREPGLVEIWPAEAKAPATEPDAWEEPVDAAGGGSPAVRLAIRVAEQIKIWLSSGERIAATGKPLRPGDVLVLVRKRGPFVEAVNRALKERVVAVAGADRLDVAGHILAQDLVAAARVALLPDDDLTLAAVARSPLIGISEAALFRLAHGRDGRLLWTAVREKAAAGDDEALRLEATVLAWMRRAERGEPFAFFARLVGPDGARAAYRARFGREADEVIDEFLDLTLAFEGEEASGLGGFIARMARTSAPIRREFEAGGNEVRVMTVHGAKGLEAPVVFLIDPGNAPASDANLPAIMRLGGERGAPLIWRQGGARPEPVAAEAARFTENQAAEYRRLLYVGLTRARDRLVIAGVKGADKGAEARWHGLVAAALEAEAEEVVDADGNVVLWRWRSADEAGGAQGVCEAATAETTAEPLPDWLRRPPPAAAAAPALRPSRALGEAEETPAMAEASRRGTAIHRLMELLPEIEPERRREVAAAHLLRQGAEATQADADALAGRLLGLFADPETAPLFAEGGRSEAPITGMIDDGRGGAIPVSGQVDRLAVTDEDVIIADYKTARHPPAAVPGPYVLQLALYRAVLRRLWPERPVRALIVWTELPRAEEVAAKVMDAALAAYLAGRANE